MIYKNFTSSLSILLPQIKRSRNNIILPLTAKCIVCRSLNQTGANVSNDIRLKLRRIFVEGEFEKEIDNTILNVLPKDYIKLTDNPRVTYLIDKNTAKKFTSLIMDDLSKNMKFVGELNPGLGLLTEELLKAGVPYIHLYEGHSSFHNQLNHLIKKFPNQLELRKRNLLMLTKLLYIDDLIMTSTVANLFKGVERRNWEDESPLQLIGVVNDTTFMKHLLLSILYHNALMIYGRPTFYFALSPSLWNRCSNINSTRTILNFMYNMLYDIKLLGTLDRTSFVPWQIKKLCSRKNNILLHEDHKLLYVVKLEPKVDLFNEKFTKDDTVALWHFMLLGIKSKRVIPTLENIIPGCGVRLIAKNINIFTKFDDLTNAEVLNLYYDFRSWPEYQKSSFILSIQDNILKYSYCNVENVHPLNINMD